MSEGNRVRIEQHGGLGLAWIAGWLFTIGYLGLSFWNGFLALFIWPYFLGAELADPPPRAPAAVEESAPL
jgi:hypothetical protein